MSSQRGMALAALPQARIWVPLTNDINTEDTPDSEMGGPFHCPRKSEKENKPSVSPDPFEETLEDEKGSLDSKGSS